MYNNNKNWVENKKMMEDNWSIFDLYGIPEITFDNEDQDHIENVVTEKNNKNLPVLEEEDKANLVLPTLPNETRKCTRSPEIMRPPKSIKVLKKARPKQPILRKRINSRKDFSWCRMSAVTLNNQNNSKDIYEFDEFDSEEIEKWPTLEREIKRKRLLKLSNQLGKNKKSANIVDVNRNKKVNHKSRINPNKIESPPTKKSKKSSKSRKTKSQLVEEDETSGDLVIVDEASAPMKMKMTPTKSQTNVNASTSTNKKRKKRDSASSDEERWLTAIESGKLEDVDDELKKIKPKDPALMTARQRAMYDRGADGSPATSAPTLMSLPNGYKEKVMTAEAIQKAALKSQKRKQMADEKREKDKKKTMERLLKKQDSKAAKAASKTKAPRSNLPVILYKQNMNTTMMSYPSGFHYPLSPAIADEPPKPKYCSMGCGNLKRYTCSKTGIPLCSLECYNRNISRSIF